MGLPKGTVTMYPKLERREWIFGTALDPRDARIAELEAALQMIQRDLGQYPETTEREKRTLRTISIALMPPPENSVINKGDEDAT